MEMEKRLNLAPMLSLKEMALRRVAVLLSIDFEILRFFWKDNASESLINTHEDKVKYKLSELTRELPESLRKEMIDKVRPISLEIQEWTGFHQWMRISAEEIDIPEKLFWTSAGTIDYKKTAEALLSCEVLDVEERFKLACRHCLEDYIPILWEKLAENSKKYFRNTYIEPDLAVCWARILKGEFSELDCLWRGSDRNLTSFNQWAFEYSARDWKKSAAEYFFLKLTLEEREASVMRTTLNVLSDSDYQNYLLLRYDILCYLLSLMTPEQQMEIIKECPVNVLYSFCVMFWQDLLVENAGLIWTFLSESDYDELLEKILTGVEFDACHPKSFREFFITSPLEFKKYFVYHEYGQYGNPAASFLDALIIKEDSESIICIFRNLDAADRAAIVFNPDILRILKYLDEDKRRMVEVCLREAKLCREDSERLKECPDLRRVIEELYESDATAENDKKGQKRKLENCSQ